MGDVHITDLIDPDQLARLRDIVGPDEEKRKFTAEQRHKAPTMPGTDSYPIENLDDLANAIAAYGRSKPEDRDRLKRWLLKRARELKASEETIARIQRLGSGGSESGSKTRHGSDTQARVDRLNMGGSMKDDEEVLEVKEADAPLEHKADTGAQVLSADDESGVVEALVSVTGIEDKVKDTIEPGAYTKTMAEREPIGVWSHDDKTWVSRTEEAREIMPGDPFFRGMKTMDGKPWPLDAGAVYVKTRFNLETPHGAAAYSDVKFFKGKTGWSIGYKATKAYRNPRTGSRRIKELAWYEYSPVMVGAASQPMTLSVKSLAQPVDPNDPTGLVDDATLEELEPADLARYVELKESLGLEVKDRVRTAAGQAKYGQPIGSVIIPDALNSLSAGDLKEGMEVDFQGMGPGGPSDPVAVKGPITKVSKSGNIVTVTVGGKDHKIRESSPVTVTKGMPKDAPLRDADLAKMIKEAMAKGDTQEVAMLRRAASVDPKHRRAALEGKPPPGSASLRGTELQGTGGRSGPKPAEFDADIAGMSREDLLAERSKLDPDLPGEGERYDKIMERLQVGGDAHEGGTAVMTRKPHTEEDSAVSALKDIFKAKGGANLSDVAYALGVTTPEAKKRIDAAIAAGKVEKRGHFGRNLFPKDAPRRKSDPDLEALSSVNHRRDARGLPTLLHMPDSLKELPVHGVPDDVLDAYIDADPAAEFKRSRASLDRSPRSNWVEETGELPGYIREVARAIHEDQGLPLSRAIPIAIGRIKKWAHGGGGVNADTVAKAAAAVAAWEKLKARAHAKYDTDLMDLMEAKGYLADLEDDFKTVEPDDLDDVELAVLAEVKAEMVDEDELAVWMHRSNELKAISLLEEGAAIRDSAALLLEEKKDDQAAGGKGKGKASSTGKAKIVRTHEGELRYGVRIGQAFTEGSVGERGEAGPDTQKAQQALVKMGLLEPRADGSVHGIFGPKTEEAVRKFQRRQGMPVTGKLDQATQDAIQKQAATPQGDSSTGGKDTAGGGGSGGSSSGGGGGTSAAAGAAIGTSKTPASAGKPAGGGKDEESSTDESDRVRSWFSTLPRATQEAVIRRARALLKAGGGR